LGGCVLVSVGLPPHHKTAREDNRTDNIAICVEARIE
jgi:hypothetical protein